MLNKAVVLCNNFSPDGQILGTELVEAKILETHLPIGI